MPAGGQDRKDRAEEHKQSVDHPAGWLECIDKQQIEKSQYAFHPSHPPAETLQHRELPIEQGENERAQGNRKLLHIADVDREEVFQQELHSDVEDQDVCRRLQHRVALDESREDAGRKPHRHDAQKTPGSTTPNSRESPAAAPTVARLKARSASSSASTTFQNPRSARRTGCPATSAAVMRASCGVSPR